MVVDRKTEADIDALLSSDEPESVVDTLLGMSHVSTADSVDENWERVLNARLQARLARRMREMLEREQDPKDSRSAA